MAFPKISSCILAAAAFLALSSPLAAQAQSLIGPSYMELLVRSTWSRQLVSNLDNAAAFAQLAGDESCFQRIQESLRNFAPTADDQLTLLLAARNELGPIPGASVQLKSTIVMNQGKAPYAYNFVLTYGGKFFAATPPEGFAACDTAAALKTLQQAVARAVHE